jgi:hypothetical protein
MQSRNYQDIHQFHSPAEWRDQLRRFLSPLAPEIRHRDVADRITHGTGKWLLEHPELERWLGHEDDGARILCCIGDPGVGKTGLACVVSFTVMSSFTKRALYGRCLSFEALDRLQSTDNSALAFVYCDDSVQKDQTPTNLIGSLLGQLTNRLSEEHPVVKELLRRRLDNKLVDLASGIDYIRRISTSNQLAKIRIGADGLDELIKEHRLRLLRELATLSHLHNVHFLFFGRSHSGIQDDIHSCFQEITSTAYLEITGNLTVGDRRLFLQEKLKDSEGFDEELRTLIIEKLAPLDSTYVIDVH